MGASAQTCRLRSQRIGVRAGRRLEGAAELPQHRAACASFTPNPNKASELGRIGGRSKGRAAVDNSEPLPTVDNAIAVRDLVARLIADVHTGKLHPRVAAGLAPLMNLQLRAIETANLELRVEKLEKMLTKLASDRGQKVVAQPTDSWAAQSSEL